LHGPAPSRPRAIDGGLEGEVPAILLRRCAIPPVLGAPAHHGLRVDPRRLPAGRDALGLRPVVEPRWAGADGDSLRTPPLVSIFPSALLTRWELRWTVGHGALAGRARARLSHLLQTDSRRHGYGPGWPRDRSPSMPRPAERAPGPGSRGPGGRAGEPGAAGPDGEQAAA